MLEPPLPLFTLRPGAARHIHSNITEHSFAIITRAVFAMRTALASALKEIKSTQSDEKGQKEG